MSGDLLDRLAERLTSWSDGLWEDVGPGMGGFRKNRRVGVNLLSSTDVAWILHAIGLDDPGGPRRRAWVSLLQSRQEPPMGRFRYEPHAETKLSSGHAFWHAVRALNILGGDVAVFPEYLRPTCAVAGLRRFFDSVDWAGPQSNHHEVLGLVPILVNRAGPEWREVFYDKLAEQRHPERGTWPRADTVNISRTFAYTCLHRAAGRMPERPERIVDAILCLQDETGLWGGGPGFLTMDCAYLLIRIPRATAYRLADAGAALDRLRAAVMWVVENALDEVLLDTHGTLALVGTLALLQEAFPEELASVRPWRFDWDDVRFYRSGTIACGRAE